MFRVRFNRPHLIIIAACFTIVLPVLVAGYISGPPDRRTGAPGEGSCIDCHGAAAGDGSVVLTGVPENYGLNDIYTLTVSVQDPGQQSWGFEITAVDIHGDRVGTFSIVDAVNTQLSQSTTAPMRYYVKQTTAGTYSGTADGPVSWNIGWTAPMYYLGTVTFYVAAIAANGDQTAAGDFVYMTSVTTRTADCCTHAGDANNNGFTAIQDITYLINYLYKQPGKPAPPCPGAGDANGDWFINVRDITAIINWMYKHGADLVCPQ